MLRSNGQKSSRHAASTPKSLSPRRKKAFGAKASFTHDLNATLAKLASFVGAQRHQSPRLCRMRKPGRKLIQKRLASLPGTPQRAFRSPATSYPPSPKSGSPVLGSTAQAESFFERLGKPLSSAKALDLFQNFLSGYEKVEILNYREVYFLGLKAAKLRAYEQFGFDDDRGDYHVTLWDHLAYRFEAVHVLGKGSFGQVLQCFDHQRQDFCAVKVIRNKPRFHQQAQVEVRILAHIAAKDRDDSRRVVHMREHFYFRGHLCIAFELLSTNLYQVLKQNLFRGLAEGLVKRFAVQILIALRFLRKEKIIHCDVKPENILLKKVDRSGLKLVDFGSACFDSEKMYTYVQSRFYRAPEVLLGLPYGTAIDMWSFGCIVAELATGLPLFAGRTEADQLLAIMELRGTVPDSMLASSPKRKEFFDSDSHKPLESRFRRSAGELRLSEKLAGASSLLVDVVDKCLQWDPQARLTPTEALRHAWVTEDDSLKDALGSC